MFYNSLKFEKMLYKCMVYKGFRGIYETRKGHDTAINFLVSYLEYRRNPFVSRVKKIMKKIYSLIS
ncbi:hypothetical protein BK746_16530 [Bacillus thuringiensis serovar yosoo]|uniref:Uncharacterized protein n=1 Tax=Bacillus thuringiensis serovar yosoo TaxID=180848 RepID=A0A9X6F863_BACTU|nr:hypothetical protein BK746_16530 [Bacillus thuringiensis serovar yosoo]